MSKRAVDLFRHFGVTLAESEVSTELYAKLVVHYLNEFYPYKLNPRLNGNVSRWREWGRENIDLFYQQRIDQNDIIANGDKAKCIVEIRRKKENA